MAKRSATTQLTSDNFDLEDQNERKEEKGVFKKASEDELKKREIKKAKRTLPPNGEKSSTNPFSALKLFNTVSLPPPPANAFVKLVPDTQPMSLQRSPIHKLTPPSQPLSSESKKESSKYLSRLKDLNVSVSEWISQHVKKNAYIDLTPVFDDYKKYMAEIEESSEKENEEEREGDEMETRNGSDCDEEDQEGGESEEEKVTKDIPLHVSSSNKDDDDTSLVNMRCKLFYKKETEFVELGLGNVRITKGEKGGVDVLLRNDTAMKKILLNVHLSKGVPLSVMKNRVLIVCMPNPPLDQSDEGNKPVTYLIKVKDEFAAKNLHTTITANL